MVRIVIASSSRDAREQVGSVLRSAGFQIYRACASGGELRRVLHDCEDGVIIVAGGLSDCRLDELLCDFGAHIQILMIAKPTVQADYDAPQLFRLNLPVSSQAIVGAVEMLTQLHRKSLPRRAGDEKALVDRAKEVLMSERGMSEAEAHRHLQQYAMNHGMKMADYAAEIINASKGTKESTCLHSKQFARKQAPDK